MVEIEIKLLIMLISGLLGAIGVMAAYIAHQWRQMLAAHEKERKNHEREIANYEGRILRRDREIEEYADEIKRLNERIIEIYQTLYKRRNGAPP